MIFLYNPFGDNAIAEVAEAVNAAIADHPDRVVYVVYYNPVAGHRFDAAPLLRRYLAATLPYATDELGYGPDSEDPVVIWQGGAIALAPIDTRANARIEIVDPALSREVGPEVGAGRALRNPCGTARISVGPATGGRAPKNFWAPLETKTGFANFFVAT